MLASTSDRVAENTSCDVNAQIRRQTEANIHHYAAAGDGAIGRRLTELDHEWDVERCLETMAPSLSLIGLCLGTTVNRKWLILPVVVQSFFLQHAIQGWCPPLAVLRRLGVRTNDEINQERYALKALRGDFDGVTTPSEAHTRAYAAMGAVEPSPAC